MRGWVRWAMGVSLAALAGCTGTGSSSNGEWQQARLDQGSIGTVLVIGLTPNERGRMAFEQTLVNELSAGGTVRAIPSYRLGPELSFSRISTEAVLATVEKHKADAVLLTRMGGQESQFDRKAEQTRQRGAAVQVSESEDDSMTLVIASSRSTEILPGEEMIRVSNDLHTALYFPDRGAAPVYTARTNAKFELTAEAQVEAGASSFAQVLAAELRRDGVFGR